MNEKFGNEKTDVIDFVCLGCKYHDIKLIATDCAECKIRSCVKTKGKDFCATCDEFETCGNIKPYRGDGKSTRDKMNAFLRIKNIHASIYEKLKNCFCDGFYFCHKSFS